MDWKAIIEARKKSDMMNFAKAYKKGLKDMEDGKLDEWMRSLKYPILIIKSKI